MGKFLPGFFIGVTIGLLIAPQKGSELRRELADGYKQIQSKISQPKTSINDINTTTNNDTNPIILPADALASAKPTDIPLGTSYTPSSTSSTNASPSTYNTDPMETLKDTKPNANKPYQDSGKRSTSNKSQAQNRNRS